MHTVYILKCSDGSHYMGCTGNLEERLKRHNKGEVSYTKLRLLFDVVLTINFPEKYKALAFEKLKSGRGRAFMYKRFI
ncbi:putative endonuclease [Roseivirga ehrenbergii]|uniref:Excinuclease ABC subunit C n=1 Tax=Roseivirga ehrenbergii (strain DSM 102268 / JCM 13514 / KCTC 12282 / NCIMB 14502 / KMM 6017) TaxID=279360 RepID=A0A150XTK1_ROSEK|nr:GIY-YIG nuclease family protein [Roseivirga ehrenbergii]KYG81955.1 excinuclease ABC subunit C [Roseivirga ehrenbergii]TCL01773.1 putative endonuclease [Roseivirga ehrenbergii]